MKRVALAGAASVAGVLGVVVMHGSSPAAVKLSPAGTSRTPSADSGEDSGSGAGSSTPSSSSSSSTTTTSPTASSSGVRTAVGPSENYGYGELSVKVTVQGSRISDVSVVSLQVAEPYSQSLANEAIPTLRNEVLSAQSAQINGVSGATYTSEAYAQSVQAALDTLHVK